MHILSKDEILGEIKTLEKKIGHDIVYLKTTEKTDVVASIRLNTDGLDYIGLYSLYMACSESIDATLWLCLPGGVNGPHGYVCVVCGPKARGGLDHNGLFLPISEALDILRRYINGQYYDRLIAYSGVAHA